ncbi:hypothetical protein DFQ28_003626 [Apophysomyces sp. BC1034]|nr:hypothetical protein DFQ30_001849 [Apophysomyces sp. BC1015]KAG0182897.1 hypothetical protein DFQ29_001335 [Apophysomyces sp. BC1021]KAG0193706.1 hypothetical protein DFQ28_003626 [Apophysomyces sp. BC1034]
MAINQILPEEHQFNLNATASLTDTLLNEDDQKAFSNFLDTFFMDQATADGLNSLNEALQPNSFHPSGDLLPLNEELEESRRNSILQSLDQHRQLFTPLSIPDSSLPPIRETKSPDLVTLSSHLKKRRASDNDDDDDDDDEHNKRPSKKKSTVRSHKELLTEEEKRANHIASEQKRRSTIRSGFKDLTDLVPTLKNINNSKSTVLFKAVEYIRHLERRNKGLREKISTLEVRAEVEGRRRAKTLAGAPHLPLHTQSAQNSRQDIFADKRIRRDSHDGPGSAKGLPASAAAALLAHKTQQKQLLALQEQLQLHQKLLAQQQEMKDRTRKREKRSNALSPRLHRYLPSSDEPKAGFRSVESLDTDPTEEPLKATVSA